MALDTPFDRSGHRGDAGLRGAAAGHEAAFRIDAPRDVLDLLRALHASAAPLALNPPAGSPVSSLLRTIDAQRGRIGLAADAAHPGMPQLVAGNEAVAVGYLDRIKIQFDLHGLALVHGPEGAALQAALPAEAYRFQRRDAFRVQASAPHGPRARLHHPAAAGLALDLRVLDVSAGGCALLLPGDAPPLPSGSVLADADIELDAETRFPARLVVLHTLPLSAIARGGFRLGCEWSSLDSAAERALQRWIDRTQRLQRALGAE